MSIISKSKSTFLGSPKRKIATALLILVVLPASAFAAWQIMVNSPGGAKWGSLAAPSSVTAGSPSGVLLPGGTSDIAFQINNDTNRPLLLTAIAPVTGQDSGAYAQYANVEAGGGLSIPVPTGSSRVIVPNALRAVTDVPTEAQSTTFEKGARITLEPAT